MAVRFSEFDAARLQREAKVAGEAFACDAMLAGAAAGGYLSCRAFWVACLLAAIMGAFALALG